MGEEQVSRLTFLKPKVANGRIKVETVKCRVEGEAKQRVSEMHKPLAFCREMPVAKPHQPTESSALPIARGRVELPGNYERLWSEYTASVSHTPKLAKTCSARISSSSSSGGTSLNLGTWLAPETDPLAHAPDRRRSLGPPLRNCRRRYCGRRSRCFNCWLRVQSVHSSARRRRRLRFALAACNSSEGEGLLATLLPPREGRGVHLHQL